MQWTIEQQRAITESGNLLVAAAAGSGKTAVLTERIVRLICEGASVDEFLVVTFTKAAAAEMKKRIENKLRERAALFQASGEKELSKKLNDAASSISRAHISTLHSFCTRLLRRHFNSAGLDPAFRVGDETEMAIYKKDVLDEIIEENYERENNSDFIRLSESFNGDDNLCDMVLQLFNDMFSRPEPFEYLNKSVEAYNINEEALASSPAVFELLDNVKSTLKAHIDAYCAVRDDYALTPSFEKALVFIDDELSKLRSILLASSYDTMREAIFSFEFEKLSCFARGTSEEDKAPFKKARAMLKKSFKSFYSMFSLTLSEHTERLNNFYPVMRALKELVEQFYKAYSEIKSENAVIDYTDMEHMTLSLLKNGLIANEYRNKFKYIFVDEYQDSNLVQESILSHIKREDNLFLVGDVKQSIYGFRLAEPKLFMEKYDLYASSDFGTRIDLNANFRSSHLVINSVNEIFSKIMRRENCSIEYDENAALKSGVENMCKGNIELHLIDRYGEELKESDDSDESDTETEDTERGLSEAEAEARLVAARIREIISSEEYTNPFTGETRPYKYSDFAILHHSPKNISKQWVETLKNEGIPALSDHGGDYFDAIEVQIFMNLLRVIDNRRQDIPLVSVLCSVIGNFKTEELIRLVSLYKSKENGEEIIDALINASNEDTSLGQKCRSILEKIDIWSEKCRLLPLPEFLNILLDETHFYEYVRALRGGDVRANNLDALIIRAQGFTVGGPRSLSSFITFMDKASKHSSESAVMKSSNDVVSVLSVHKSKGLEYPVVILAGIDAKFNDKDSAKNMLTDGELGIGIRPVFDNAKMDTIYRKSILSKLKKKNISERMRLLYVAMTRAKEQLILIGVVDNVLKRYSEASKVLTPARAMHAKTFLDWLMYLNIQPHIHPSPSSALFEDELDESEYKLFASNASLLTQKNELSPFAWSYPFVESTVIPSKVSVSHLSGNTIQKRTLPHFVMQSEGVKQAVSRGTATHTVMEHISIMPHTKESIIAEIQRLLESGFITAPEAEAVNINSIIGFFESDIGKRLCASKRVERELKFNHRVPASKIMDTSVSDTVLLQGMIDCCFIEDGEWVLIDYKTDYVEDASLKHEAAQKHRKQLSLYADALFALTGITVKEKYICFLRLKDGAVKL